MATEEFHLQGKPQTDSRISLLSGIHRKDVKRLREEKQQEQKEKKPASALSLTARLMKIWSSDPKRLDETGRHRPLPRLMSEGGTDSFEALVSSVSKDIRSRVILDEWLRSGLAYLDNDGRVCLNTEAFLKGGGFEEKAYYFGQNVHDHMSAAAHNLLEQQPLFLERSVQYGRLTQQSIAELAELSKQAGLQALEVVSKRASELESVDKDNPDAKQRMSFGVYYFNDEKNETQNSHNMRPS